MNVYEHERIEKIENSIDDILLSLRNSEEFNKEKLNNIVWTLDAVRWDLSHCHFLIKSSLWVIVILLGVIIYLI